jgi:predicted SAM-dependent methyltransferase
MKVKNKIANILKFIRYFNLEASPAIYLSSTEGGLKLHLGAGKINLQGWINVDARQYSHVHLHTSNFDLTEFSDNSISEIYMCHVLEHFSFSEAVDLINIFRLKLKRNGILRLSVPCFDNIIKIYHGNDSKLDSIKLALMGGQDYEYNFHKSIYNHDGLSELLLDNGFHFIESWNSIKDFGIDIGDWSSSKIETKYGLIDISLNLKAVKR